MLDDFEYIKFTKIRNEVMGSFNATHHNTMSKMNEFFFFFFFFFFVFFFATVLSNIFKNRRSYNKQLVTLSIIASFELYFRKLHSFSL